MKKAIEPKEPTITIFPYPVWLLSSEYDDESDIAPVGWVSPVCNQPPLFGVALRPSRRSYELIERSRRFALNLPTNAILDEVDYCGTYSGKDVDKTSVTGLTLIRSTDDSPPIIKECPLNLELSLEAIHDYGNHKHLVGKVERILIEENIRGYFQDFFIAIGTSYYKMGSQIGECQQVHKRKYGGWNGNA